MRRRSLLMVIAAFAGAAACNAVTGVHELTFVDGVAGAGSSGKGVGGGGGDSVGAGGGESCGPLAELLDAEGCQCTTKDETRECYLGDPGPQSACNVPGVQACVDQGGDLIWGVCERASMPSQEVCFDEVDNDCDGELDEQCPCSDAFDLCKDSEGMILDSDLDHLFVVPNSVMQGDFFDLYLVSKLPLENALLQVDAFYCAGAADSSNCAAGAGCAGWSAIHQRVETQDSTLFTGGYNQLTMLINENEPSPPCDGDHDRMVSAQVFIRLSD